MIVPFACVHKYYSHNYLYNILYHHAWDTYYIACTVIIMHSYNIHDIMQNKSPCQSNEGVPPEIISFLGTVTDWNPVQPQPLQAISSVCWLKVSGRKFT